MKKVDKVDLNKLKSKIKERPLYYCKCGLSSRLPYCDWKHGCDKPVKEINNDKPSENGSGDK
jgi:CDGSH-type Zn-finger protein